MKEKYPDKTSDGHCEQFRYFTADNYRTILTIQLTTGIGKWCAHFSETNGNRAVWHAQLVPIIVKQHCSVKSVRYVGNFAR